MMKSELEVRKFLKHLEHYEDKHFKQREDGKIILVDDDGQEESENVISKWEDINVSISILKWILGEPDALIGQPATLEDCLEIVKGYYRD